MPIDTDLLIVFPSLLVGLAMILRFLHARARLRSSEDVEELRRALHDVQLELEELRAEQAAGHAELHERIDFAERLLTARPRAADEKEPTPV
jgi:ribosomal protein L29